MIRKRLLISHSLNINNLHLYGSISLYYEVFTIKENTDTVEKIPQKSKCNGNNVLNK